MSRSSLSAGVAAVVLEGLGGVSLWCLGREDARDFMVERRVEYRCLGWEGVAAADDAAANMVVASDGDADKAAMMAIVATSLP